MAFKPRKPMCPGCAEAQELITRLSQHSEQKRITPAEIVAGMPLLLETALSYLLSEFDYEAEIGSRTAEAIRMIASAADRAQVLLETPDPNAPQRSFTYRR